MTAVPDHAARIVALAGRAIARVDRDGPRALTLLSVEQIEAIVMLAALSHDGIAVPRRPPEGEAVAVRGVPVDSGQGGAVVDG